MPPSPNKLSHTPSFSKLLLLLLIAALVLVGVERQPIQDWFKLRGYQPPAAVAQLADQDTMNNYTRHLFYLNKPQLPSTVASFRKACPENKDTIVLGCYHPDQNGIYIYAVSDPSLAGVQQVTAAHEVLHSVYARLSNKERQALDTELNDFYKHGLTNQRVLDEVKLYQQTEPTAVLDEMSCTFGTELPSLPPALEAYYTHYFTNRAAIVAYEQQYDAAFTSRQATIKADDQQLSAQKQQINSLESTLQAQLNQIHTDKARLDSLLASGQNATYNAGVTSYNTEIRTYNDGVGSLQAAIASYNQLVSARNQVAGQLATIDSAIDTRLTPKTQ
jgi:hypothetical protein